MKFHPLTNDHIFMAHPEELMSMDAAHPEVSGLVRSAIDLNQDRLARIDADLRDKA